MGTSDLMFTAIMGLAFLIGVVVIWPQAGFVLFLSVPLTKPLLRTYMPFLVSYTLDMAVTMVAFIGIAWHALRVGRSVRGLIPRGFMIAWIILMCLVWIMLPFSRQMGYGWKKALMFSIFDTLSVLLPLLYFRRFEDTRGLILALVILGVFSTLCVILFPTTMANMGGGRYTVLYASPLAPADFASYLIIVLLSLWIAERRLWQAIGVVVLVPMAIYAIILTGTRGPLFSLPFVLLAVMFLYRRVINLMFVVSGSVIALLVLAATVSVVTPEMTQRFQSKFLVDTFFGRASLADVTLVNWLDNPVFGNGTGDTAYQIGGANFEGYPHNLLLEAANELGVLGLVCMLVVFGYGLKPGLQLSRPEMEGTYAKTVSVPVFGCYLHHVLFSFKTGGYAGSYTFYFFLGCTIALSRLWRLGQAEIEDRSVEPWLSTHLSVDQCS